MILPPVGNKGEGFFLLDSIQGGLDRHRVKADRLGRFADTQQGNAFPGYPAFDAQILQAVTFPVIFGHHPQASGTPIHGVELFVVREAHYFFYGLLNECLLFLL